MQGLLTGVVAGLVLAVAAAAAFTGAFRGEPSADRGAPERGPRAGYAPVVTMVAVRDSAVARTLEAIGEARASRSIAIAAETTGVIKELSIAPGQRVAQGDLLMRVDRDDAEVALNRAQAEFPIAKANAERYADLRDDDAASGLEADAAQNALLEVRARMNAAQVEIDRARITAPFDGVVGLTTFEPGDYIREGDVVTTLDDISSIVVEFDAPQESAAYLNINQPVSARLASAPGATYEGRITAIDSRIDPQSRSLSAEAMIDNAAGRLIPGAVVAVRTVSQGEAAFAVPGLAVQYDRAGGFVWRRGREGAAERVSVTVLQRRDETAIVDGELKAGDAIVSEGSDRVRTGLPLPALEGASGFSVGSANGAQ